MAAYTLRRLLMVVPLLLAVSLVVFALVRGIGRRGVEQVADGERLALAQVAADQDGALAQVTAQLEEVTGRFQAFLSIQEPGDECLVGPVEPALDGMEALRRPGDGSGRHGGTVYPLRGRRTQDRQKWIFSGEVAKTPDAAGIRVSVATMFSS